jgi:S1-C subfamily serine protease
VIGVHETFDLALFRVSRTSSSTATRPKPLTIASQFDHAEQGRRVYVVGYPAWDGRRNDPEPMLRIFANIFNVKRLQPGEIDSTPDQRHIFVHDCSTLGGNSGSPVVDLETNQVIGLHFGGRYLQGNSAVALWQLTADPLLKKARVHFA